MRLLTISLMSALLMLACGDDTKQKVDGPTTKLDRGGSVDKPAGTKETSVVGEGGGTSTCLDIATCEKTCGTDTTCIGKCAAKGCASAQKAINDLSTCAITKCTADCIGGYNNACDACAAKNCTTEYPACQNNKC